MEFDSKPLATDLDGTTDVIGNPYFAPIPGFIGRYELRSMDLKITLNQTTLPNSSKEFITATILHEALHAYFRISNISFDHDVMVNQYIPWFMSALQSLYPALSDFDAKSLAYGGLTDTTAIISGLDSAMAESFANNNKSFHDGRSGTKCH